MSTMNGRDKPSKNKYAPTRSSGIPEPLRPFSRRSGEPAAQERALSGVPAQNKSGRLGAFIHMREVPLQQPDKPAELTRTQRKTRGGAIQKKQPRVKNKKAATAKRRGRRKKGIAAFIIILLFSGVIACSAVIFRVNQIEVTGNVKMSGESIAELSGIKAGSHMLVVDTGKARENLERNPYIDVVEIKRAYPNTVRIFIREREEAAVIVHVGAYVVIDENGHVLAIESTDSYPELTKVHGMSSSGYELNHKLGGYGDFHSKTLTDVMNALITCGLLSETADVDVSNALSIRLVMKNGLDVRLGQPSSIEAKLKNLANVIKKITEQDAKEGVLYLSEENAVFSPDESGEKPGNGRPDSGEANKPGPADEPDDT